MAVVGNADNIDPVSYIVAVHTIEPELDEPINYVTHFTKQANIFKIAFSRSNAEELTIVEKDVMSQPGNATQFRISSYLVSDRAITKTGTLALDLPGHCVLAEKHPMRDIWSVVCEYPHSVVCFDTVSGVVWKVMESERIKSATWMAEGTMLSVVTDTNEIKFYDIALQPVEMSVYGESEAMSRKPWVDLTNFVGEDVGEMMGFGREED